MATCPGCMKEITETNQVRKCAACGHEGCQTCVVGEAALGLCSTCDSMLNDEGDDAGPDNEEDDTDGFEEDEDDDYDLGDFGDPDED